MCLRIAWVLLALTIALPPAIAAQTPSASASATAQTTGEAPSAFDQIWKFSQWYENTSNPVIQRVLFSGRFHEDFSNVHADQGNHHEWNVRRLRFGPRITFLRDYLFHVEIDLNPQERDPTYVRLTDLYVRWARSAPLVITVGKQSVPFTQEGATSSRELITAERSALAHNMWFPQEYVPGVSASGRRAQWTYMTGVFSAGEANRDVGEFTSGFFTLGRLGYNFAARLGIKEALLVGEYVFQHADAGNTFTRQLDHVASINLKLEEAGWGLRTDVTLASGYAGQSNLAGAMVMPYLNVTERLQLVAQYTRVSSADPNGVQLGNYANRVVDGRGDEYDEAYLGANYYVYGHKLKVQTGLEYGKLNDRANDGGAYAGFAFTAALRVGW